MDLISESLFDFEIVINFIFSRGAFIPHAKVYGPVFPSNIPTKITKLIYIPNNHVNTIIPKVYQTTIIPRPISGTSINQLKSITGKYLIK